MKKILHTFVLLLVVTGAIRAQRQDADTTLHYVAEQAPYPLLASCDPSKRPDWNEDSIRRCAEQQFMRLVIRNVVYPPEAREAGVQGSVVASFIIEKDGRMRDIRIVKDIGHGCGDEALRILQALDEAGLRWAAGRIGGQPVRMHYTFPLRFRLEEALPYYENEQGIKVYANPDTEVQFEGGLDSLLFFVLNQLQYPEEYAASCKTGVMEMGLLILPNGAVQIEQQLDFNNLGFDFQFEAIRLVRKTVGRWIPATYRDEAVAASYPLRVVFKSDAPGCKSANERFDQVMLLADEGVQLLENGEEQPALDKWTQALQMQPDNTELLYYRATVLINQNRREEACADLNRIKELLGVTWFESMHRVVCGW